MHIRRQATVFHRSSALYAASLCAALLGMGAQAGAPPRAAPRLYHQPAYESPVEGAPDDLLLLAGNGLAADDTVVYRALHGTAAGTSPPEQLPPTSSSDIGSAPIVSAANVPRALTIKLPREMRTGQAYALWVRSARGDWSNPVAINDARPMWFTPAFVYATHPLASLPRELKIVGRNLQPAPGRVTRIRLSGPTEIIGNAEGTGDDDDATPGQTASTATLAHYIARLRLPESLAPGRYRVALERGAGGWVDLTDQFLEVRPDPARKTRFDVSDARFGNCRPDGGNDATPCVLHALAAAASAGGGSVYFGPGTWDLVDSSQPGIDGREGIVVPAGVSLRGAGRELTRLVRHAEWNARIPEMAAFTLLGQSEVSGFTFRDQKVYVATDAAGSFLQLGYYFERLPALKAAQGAQAAQAVLATVNDITITRNVFDKTMIGVADGGLPIAHLFITDNTFGAYRSALELEGKGYNMAGKYRIDDSVIAHNLFAPSSKLDLVGKTGPLASEIGAGRRLDFSDNTADGTAVDFLYAPSDAKGWRAAFFWNMNGSSEEVLVSRNTATCTGDKIGDGEAITFDNNANTYAFADGAPAVTAASRDTVAVAAPLAARQNRRDVPLGSYYVDHWVQIVQGSGVGQARRIVAYTTDSNSHVTTFRVAPEWDVVPVPGDTRISVGREFWQVYTVGNRVDNRKPLCQKSNRSRQTAGAISLWAQSADSVIAANRQYDSDGIFVQQAYVLPEHPCADCTMASLFQSFLDIRGNLIDGEYDWDNDCSASGIAIGAGAADVGHERPPTVGFGVSVSHNTVRHADGQYGGAIAQLGTWTAGPAPHRWPLSDNLLVHHNALLDLDGSAATPKCGARQRRVGITFPQQPIAWHSVLYGNTCSNVAAPIGAGGVETAVVCDADSAPNSCECTTPVR